MIPKELIETGHGMSIITMFVYGFMWLVIGYTIKGCKEYERCFKEQIQQVKTGYAHVKTKLAVNDERDNAIQSDIHEIKESINNIHKRLNNIVNGK